MVTIWKSGIKVLDRFWIAWYSGFHIYVRNPKRAWIEIA